MEVQVAIPQEPPQDVPDVLHQTLSTTGGTTYDLFVHDENDLEVNWVHWGVSADGPDAADESPGHGRAEAGAHRGVEARSQ